MKRQQKHFLFCLATAMLVPVLAFASPADEARALFNVGAQAYVRGDFVAAIQAFEQAYKVEPRPGLLFSIARAHHRQYTIDHKAGHVAVAILRLREYLGQNGEIDRRGEAVTALGELEAIAADLERRGELIPSAPSTRDVLAPRLMVSCPAEGATISLDGQPAQKAPLIAEIKPGKHQLLISAGGYVSEKREIEVAPEGVTALDVPLQEEKAQLTIRAQSGAEVSIDGNPLGALPFAGARAIEPGRHRLSIVKAGRETYLRDLRFQRGQTISIDAPMPMTTRRQVSYVLISSGLVGLGAGAVLGVLAFGHERRALEIKNQLDCCSVSVAKANEYDDYVNTRNQLRTAMGLSWGGGTVVGIAGLILYAFETPIMPPLFLSDPYGEKNETPANGPSRDVSVAPEVGAGFYGVRMVGRF